jgi:hypothetical protein
MQKVADIWYCAIDELVDKCQISYEAIKKGTLRSSDQWQSIKDPSDRRRLLIRYDTLADKYRSVVRRQLCNGFEPWDKPIERTVDPLSQRSIAERCEIACTETFRRFLALYPTSDTGRAALKTQTCLARAAAIVELIGNYIIEQDIDPRSYAPYKEVEAWFNTDGNYDFYFPKGSQYLPLNLIRLKEKVVARFGSVGVEQLPITDVIHLPRQGNKSRDKFASDPELMAWIMMARSKETNDSNAYVIRKISEVCRIVGREVPSASWFAQVLVSNKVKQLTAKRRFGADTANAGRYTHSITMARAMYAGDCWMMDATRVNIIEHETTEKGKFAFLFVIVVRDAYSGDVVGCHFDTKEDRWGYSNALKMAVKTTGYLPHTLVYDRFPGHITDEMQTILSSFEAKGVHLVCTHKATGKALLERWFDTLQTVFLSNSRYYYGEGIRSTRVYAHRSPDYLVKIRKEARSIGFDFDQAWQDAWQRVEEYRQTPLSHYSKTHRNLHLSPATLHKQSEKPNVIGVELWEQASLFWMTKVLDIRRNRIEHDVHGVRYEYPIYDVNVIYAYSRVAVRYEEADPTRVMLFPVDSEGRVADMLICELTHSAPIAMYGPDADAGRLAGRMAKIDKVEQQKAADLDALMQGATVDPEYLLNMGGRVPKDEFESVQTSVLYEQMGALVSTKGQETARSMLIGKSQPVATPPQTTDEFDPESFINNQFYQS